MTDNIKKLIEQLQLIFSIKSGLKFEIYNNKKVHTELSLNDIKKTNYKIKHKIIAYTFTHEKTIAGDMLKFTTIRPADCNTNLQINVEKRFKLN